MGWFKKTLDLQQIRPDVGTQPQKQFGVTGEQSWQREEDRIYMPDELLWVNVSKPERKVRLSLCEDYTTQVTLCLCLQSCLLQLNHRPPLSSSVTFQRSSVWDLKGLLAEIHYPYLCFQECLIT